VGNLPYQATRDQVLAIFSKYGKVLQVSLMPYGYGFIDFETPQDVQKVLKAATDNPRHFTMDARPLIVQERHPDSDGSGRRGSRRVFSNRGPRARIPHRQ
jgi:RNA recognition motif-containing protein